MECRCHLSNDTRRDCVQARKSETAAAAVDVTALAVAVSVVESAALAGSTAVVPWQQHCLVSGATICCASAARPHQPQLLAPSAAVL